MNLPRPGIETTPELERLRERAQAVSLLLGQLSPVIRAHTEVVCPNCSNVCCIERHSGFAYDDLVYLYLLGEEPTPRKTGLTDSKPCQFLGPEGCRISHSRRPYRCTWYFCSPLLEQIETNSVRGYRDFIRLLGQITREREAFLTGFAEAVKTGGGKSGRPCRIRQTG